MGRKHVQRDVTSMFAYTHELFASDNNKWGVRTYNYRKKGYDILAQATLSKKEALAFVRSDMRRKK